MRIPKLLTSVLKSFQAELSSSSRTPDISSMNHILFYFICKQVFYVHFKSPTMMEFQKCTAGRDWNALALVHRACLIVSCLIADSCCICGAGQKFSKGRAPSFMD